jgi:RNA polymerase sigma-70 factor (ECF subfamily)
MNAESDRLLVQQIRGGDEQAWQQLIDRYEGRLSAFVQRRLRNPAAVEDVVQEAFIGFANSLPNYDDTRDLQTYLFTIASYKLTDHLRRSGRHPLQNLPESQEYFDQQVDSQSGVSSIARSKERKSLEGEALVRALAHVLGRWQEQGEYERIKVLELLLVKGWANKDVAAYLKIKEQQVANIRFAAVKKISELIQNEGLSPDVFPELYAEDASAAAASTGRDTRTRRE